MNSPRRSLTLPVIAFAVAALAGLATALYLVREETPRVAQTASPQAAPADAPPESPAPTPAPAAAAESGAIRPTALPLSLVATMVRGEAKLSLATLSDEEHETRAVLAPGQALPKRPGVTLARVERERVLIDNHGVIESLTMVRTDAPAELRAPYFELEEEERIRRSVRATRIRELTDQDLERREPPIERQLPGLLAEGDIAGVYDDDNALVGVRIDAIEEGGLYDRVGLEDGDVLTSVNGVSLGDDAAGASVVTELALSDEIEIEITRADGSPQTLTVPTDELRDYLSELDAEVFSVPPEAPSQ